jgi:hypothetical protein
LRRARFRLLVATARRHVKQKKPHLLQKDCAALEALTDAWDGARPALVAALRAVAADLQAAPEEAARWRAEAAARLGLGELGGGLLLELVARTFGGAKAPPSRGSTTGLTAALGRLALLTEDAGLPLEVPTRLDRALDAELQRPDVAASPTELTALAEALLARRRYALAYSVAGTGLRRGGATAARFLLLRARSLPDFSLARRQAACDAAAELARRQRDQDLVRAAVELGRSPNTEQLTPEALERVLQRERVERSYPRGPSDDDLALRLRASRGAPCDCPECTGVSIFEDEDDDLDGFPGLPAGMPPELASALGDFAAHVDPEGRLPDPDELFRRDPELAVRLAAALEAATGSRRGRGRRKR